MPTHAQVITDEDGRIIAAHHVTDTTTSTSDTELTVHLVPRPGQREHLVELPPALADADPHDALAALHREYRISGQQLARKE